MLKDKTLVEYLPTGDLAHCLTLGALSYSSPPKGYQEIVFLDGTIALVPIDNLKEIKEAGPGLELVQKATYIIKSPAKAFSDGDSFTYSFEYTIVEDN